MLLMEFYGPIEGFNVKCVSCGKTARQWATTSRSRHWRQAIDMLLDVEAWLPEYKMVVLV